ncbi:MAG: hypothetical protein PHE29_05100 [Tissierellia bacterium]|nr:hypothetical protein [Tissierellia bacterium]
MILINKNEKPYKTVYYISACILKEIKQKKKVFNLEEFYNDFIVKYSFSNNHDNFIYALNFLYLLNKINYIDKEGITYVN